MRSDYPVSFNWSSQLPVAISAFFLGFAAVALCGSSSAAEVALGKWCIVVSNNGNAGLPPALVVFPGGSTQMGNAVEIFYALSDTHVPLSRVMLTDGFFRQASPSGPLTTSFRGFDFVSSADVRVPVPTVSLIQIGGLTRDGSLRVKSVAQSQDSISGEKFDIIVAYRLFPPGVSQTVTKLRQTVTNSSGWAVRPFWRGHLDLDETFRLFALSSMHVAIDYSAGLPAWYDSLDPEHAYVGDLAGSPGQHAYSVNGSILVFPHDTARLRAANLDITLAHEVAALPPVILPAYPWFRDFVFYRHHSPWLVSRHAFESARDHRAQILSSGGLLQFGQLSWTCRFDRDDQNNVDGDNVTVSLGGGGHIESWPDRASQRLSLRLISGGAGAN